MSTQTRKKVLIIHTGGTFGMQIGEGHSAHVASESFLGSLLQAVPEVGQLADLELKILCNIDSSDANPALWASLAQLVVDSWEGTDGFVIIHGTDTMAWTAAALSFFLPGLGKPVVLTGSQRPLSELRNDARINLIDSVELATHPLPGVFICFDSKVHLGTRATKFSSEHLHAFRSHNASVVGSFGVNLTLGKGRLKPSNPFVPSSKPSIDTRTHAGILALDGLPGIALSPSLRHALLSQSKALILRGFGSGNLPLKATEDWSLLCAEALEARTPVVMHTHCDSGSVQLHLYENGRKFREMGVISGGEMTLESLSVKLMVMLGRNIPFADRHRFFATPLAGECRSPEEHP